MGLYKKAKISFAPFFWALMLTMPWLCYEWKMFIWIPSRSRMSKPWPVIIWPEPLGDWQERMEEPNLLLKMLVKPELSWQIGSIYAPFKLREKGIVKSIYWDAYKTSK